ncbi:hypothetical protein FHL15_010516 [Xylaria flabelliformis]|uniref:Amidohydrolase-related domain-containing protein n=1 Tax=Xylaria flabelliformis TaxID=2512241 RepID=A0A553HKT5_9PEZI|nr:hypothetical protein FHL15_010516 [Xylaria flabelliformis]
MILENVVSDARDRAAARWDIEVRDGYAHSIRPSGASSETPPQLLLPPLCHPHIHLDKAYLLTCNNKSSPQHPDYSDLCPTSGSFDEALANTSRAKERYTPDDLYLRGSQLLATSYTQGVTSMRAFVELDHVTGTLPLTAAIRLKKDFSHLLELQICAFAQDPVFSTTHGDENRNIIEGALVEFADSIEALGTTPYVETSRDASLSNIEWAITTALKHNLHLDFHLDYTLDSPSPSPSQKPLIYSVLEFLGRHRWAQIAKKTKTIVIGHCTQLSVLEDAERKTLAEAVIASKLPIHFVGLPTSDLFMMGRPNPDSTSSHNRPRGTIHVPSMITELGLSACLGVNNVGNAFTPYGTGDPLQLVSWAVGIYQVGTSREAKLLYECVSTRARQAIGLDGGKPWGPIDEGHKLHGMLLLKNERVMELPGAIGSPCMTVAARQRLSIQDVVWDPPENSLRSVLR